MSAPTGSSQAAWSGWPASGICATWLMAGFAASDGIVRRRCARSGSSRRSSATARVSSRPFELLGWQKFVIGSIFGWELGAIRRFRTAFVSTARKNGKSTIEAGIGLKALIDEDEPGAEVYSAATTREQARIVFSEAERMRAASPALRRRITPTTNNLAVLDTASWFRPLSSDASRMDGLNVFVALVDEVHEHPSAEVIEKLDTGMGARLQPLMYETTIACVNRNSVCYQHWDFSTKVLEGTVPEITADRWFAYIATVDENDDWQDELAWRKANPSLGSLLRIEDLRAEVALAREMPSKQNSIRRLRLNQWTQQLARWIDMDIWAHAGLRLMQLEAPQVFGRRGNRRAAKESLKGHDVTDIVVARLLDEIAHHHVLDHAPAQRADGLLVHWGAPHLEVDNTPIVGSPRSALTSSSLVIHLLNYPQGSPAKRVRLWVESGQLQRCPPFRGFREAVGCCTAQKRGGGPKPPNSRSIRPANAIVV
jgi:hypothetical protein